MQTTEVEGNQRKYQGAVDTVNLYEKEVCVLDGNLFCCAINWTHIPSISGSYGRPVDRKTYKYSILK